MGTNYYLHRPPNPCPTCGRQDETEIHVGKSSLGWVFLWRGYREDSWLGRAIETPDQWRTFLETEISQGGELRNEYGESITLDELFDLVARKSKRVHGHAAPRRHVNLSPKDTIATGGSDVLFAEFC